MYSQQLYLIMQIRKTNSWNGTQGCLRMRVAFYSTTTIQPAKFGNLDFGLPCIKITCLQFDYNFISRYTFFFTIHTLVIFLKQFHRKVFKPKFLSSNLRCFYQIGFMLLNLQFCFFFLSTSCDAISIITKRKKKIHRCWHF